MSPIKILCLCVLMVGMISTSRAQQQQTAEQRFKNIQIFPAVPDPLVHAGQNLGAQARRDQTERATRRCEVQPETLAAFRGLFGLTFANKRIVKTSSCGTVLLTSGVPSYRQNRRFPSENTNRHVGHSFMAIY